MDYKKFRLAAGALKTDFKGCKIKPFPSIEILKKKKIPTYANAAYLATKVVEKNELSFIN